MTLSDTALDVLLKRLHLANARRVWRDLTLRAEHEQWSCRDFLALLISEEIAHRQQTRLGRVSRWARFPFLKTIDEFDFTYQSVVRLSLLGSALASDFVTEGRSLILSGKPGRGKTHLAIAIAYRAIQNGFDARFVTAAELIDDLSAAFRAGRLADALITYTHPAVLVVDEVGYLTYGTDAANMLFHVVNDRHRHKRSMIFTTNKSLTAWGHVLHDDDLAHAIIDRVLERGRLLPLDGPSMRTKHLGLDDPTSSEASIQLARSLEGEVIRISGIEAPEFPEPTRAKVGAWDITKQGAGLDASCIPWLRQRDVAVLAGENPQDVAPSGLTLGATRSPNVVPGFVLVYLGAQLIDNADLDAVAEAAAARNRWEFLFTVAPLPLRGGTGSPVNPIAIF